MKLKRKFLIGTIVGGAIGSVAGVLLAPKSGKETRAAIAKKSVDFKADVVKASGTGKNRSFVRGLLKVLKKPPKKPRS